MKKLIPAILFVGVVLTLCACSVTKQKTEKLRDIDFTVVDRREIPEEFYLNTKNKELIGMSENVFIKEGYKYITAKINEAVENGSRCARISGNYEISRAVRLPSFFTLILEDAHLRMADGVYDNMFVNEHHGTPEGNTVDGTDRAISIIGRGRVVLDGGKYNGLSERTQRKNGLPPIYKNNLVFIRASLHCFFD